MNSAISLRPHQELAISCLRDAIRSKQKRVILMAPCSFGKTRTAAFMAQAGAARGRRTIFVCDRIELIAQASRAFDALGIAHGIIQADNPRENPAALVQVASIQTLAAKRTRRAKIEADRAAGRAVYGHREEKSLTPPADTIIIDECHCVYAEHQRLIDDNPDAIVIGLSATPWTKGLGKIYERTVQPVTVRELIDAGYLIEPSVYGPSVAPDLSQVRTLAGEYREDDLEEAVNKTAIVGDIVSAWLEKAHGEPTFCFATSIAHSVRIVHAFNAVGVPAEHLDCYSKPEDRLAKLERLRSGETLVLSSVDILSKGIDFPGARCAILARPTKSKMLFIQQIGRIMRIDPESGKTRAVILDHAGNHLAMGMVTDEFDTALSMGTKAESVAREKKEAVEPKPKQCTNCRHIKPAGVRKCPACGHTPLVPDRVAVIAGELTLMTGSKAEIQRARAARFGDKQTVFSMLLHIAQQQRYGSGWVAHKYRAIFDVWPVGLDKTTAAPSDELIRWCRAENNRFKSERAARANDEYRATA